MVSASCSTQAPPSPCCHYVIISSTPSLPLSSPFTEQTHNKTHSVTLCVFHTITSGSRWAGNPLSSLPSVHFFFFFRPSMQRGASGQFSDWAILRSNGATHSRSAGGGIRGTFHHVLPAANPKGSPQCVWDLPYQHHLPFWSKKPPQWIR